jgi:hypothetical protein
MLEIEPLNKERHDEDGKSDGDGYKAGGCFQLTGLLFGRARVDSHDREDSRLISLVIRRAGLVGGRSLQLDSGSV